MGMIFSRQAIWTMCKFGCWVVLTRRQAWCLLVVSRSPNSPWQLRSAAPGRHCWSAHPKASRGRTTTLLRPSDRSWKRHFIKAKAWIKCTWYLNLVFEINYLKEEQAVKHVDLWFFYLHNHSSSCVQSLYTPIIILCLILNFNLLFK